MPNQISPDYQQQLAYLSLHDSLTGLPNRSFFIESLHQWLEPSKSADQQIALLTLDVDRFKLYNQSLGSIGGDALLKAVADRLKLIARHNDIVARFGSDEFALLIAMNSGDSIEVIAQRFYRLLNEPFLINEQALFVSLSTGIAIAPQDGNDVQTLLNNANQARLKAKQTGGNQFQFYRSSMTQAVHKRLALEQDLRQAISKQQLELFYQAKVNAQTCQLVGAEALIVWQHPTLGQINPEDFISIAEETGLIVDIGYWVLDEASRQVCLWRQELPEFQISINLSARQFLHEGLLEAVNQTLTRYSLPAAALDIEITESLAMFDIDHSTRTLQQLKTLGVQLSLDDFGTGYSSLAHLRDFPVDTLKIDRTFVMRIGTETAQPADEKMISAIIAMAKSLDLSVVAEGVENDYQRQFLKTQGCHLLQGYYCGRPVSVKDFEQLAQQRYNEALDSSLLGC
jgi:diguanylate cyclase (GGDEF)-like protein